MIQTKEIDVNLLEAEFYEKDFKFSYSSMSKLVTAPKLFYRDYILKQREESFGKHLLEGILIHYLVLEENGGAKFDDSFIVTSDTLPSENVMIVIDKVFKEYESHDEEPAGGATLAAYSTLILNTLIDINLYQALKDDKKPPAGGGPMRTGDEKRLDKVIETKTEEYFQFLINKKGRTIIDSAILDKCTRRADIVKANDRMRDLLGLDLENDGKNYGVYNEIMLDCEAVEGMPFGYKGIVDNMVVDVANKVIRINDFKTTGKNLTDFPKSVEIWNYWIQTVVYMKLIKEYLKGVLSKGGWRIEFRFLVVDKYDQLYDFEVTEETLKEWTARFEQTEKDAVYHYENREYTLPVDYISGNVKL